MEWLDPLAETSLFLLQPTHHPGRLLIKMDRNLGSREDDEVVLRIFTFTNEGLF